MLGHAGFLSSTVSILFGFVFIVFVFMSFFSCSYSSFLRLPWLLLYSYIGRTTGLHQLDSSCN